MGCKYGRAPVNRAAFSPDNQRIIAAIGTNSDETDNPIRQAWIWDAAHPEVALAAAAQNLVEEGVALGLGGDTRRAQAHFDRAQVLNPYRDYDLAREGRVAMVVKMVEKAFDEAATDNYEEARRLIMRADNANPEPDYEIRAAVDTYFGANSVELARAGNVDGAVNVLESIAHVAPDATVAPGYLSAVCWYGSLWQQAGEMLSFCEEAVARAHDDQALADFRDSRGLARALTGDYSGAIVDFATFVAFYKESEFMAGRVARVQEWIAALETGHNPFDEAMLETLREEATYHKSR